MANPFAVANRQMTSVRPLSWVNPGTGYDRTVRATVTPSSYGPIVIKPDTVSRISFYGRTRAALAAIDHSIEIRPYQPGRLSTAGYGGGFGLEITGAGDWYMLEAHLANVYRWHETAGVPGAITTAPSTDIPRFLRATVAAGSGARAVLVYVSTDGEEWTEVDSMTLDVVASGVCIAAGAAIGGAQIGLVSERYI